MFFLIAYQRQQVFFFPSKYLEGSQKRWGKNNTNKSPFKIVEQLRETKLEQKLTLKAKLIIIVNLLTFFLNIFKVPPVENISFLPPIHKTTKRNPIKITAICISSLIFAKGFSS